MTQHEITEKGPLLNDKGLIREPGWARSPVQNYDRKIIKAPKSRIKEWDYYAVLNDKFGIALTVADNAYMGFVSVTLFDFIGRKEISKTLMTPFPMGKFQMPSSSDSGDVRFERPGIFLYFENNLNTRVLSVNIANFYKGHTLSGTIILQKAHARDSMVIATPFHKSGRFYYNRKINNLKASGTIGFKGHVFNFGDTPSFAVLDWGRGVWTYQNTWYWGSASGELEGVPFGFNIGYGFGDTSAASENVLFYDGKAHKLDEVIFLIPDDSFLNPWIFKSSDKRFEMNFEPVLDRHSNTNALIIRSDQHQVFGYFTGTAVLDDGTEIILDRFFGFAEKVYNRW